MLPDAGYLEDKLDEFTDILGEKFNLDTSVFENLFKSESPIEDVYFDYTIPGVGDFEFKALDSSLLVDGVEYFRPYVRGFIVLMLFLYHIRQLVGFFGYDAGVVAGRSEHVKSMKEKQGD